MTGVEEQPEDTEETGQQPADGRNKEHHRLIDPGSNGGDCGFRAFAIALGQLNNKTATESMDPNRLQKKRSHAQTQGTRQFLFANSLEAVLGTRHQSHYHHRGRKHPEQRRRVA